MEAKKKLAIAYDLQAGLSCREIQQKHGVCYETVVKVADEFKLDRRTRRAALTDAEVEEIQKYYALGWGARRISKATGLNPDTIQNYKPGSKRMMERAKRQDSAEQPADAEAETQEATEEERQLVTEYRRKKQCDYMREYRKTHKAEIEAQAFARDLERAKAEQAQKESADREDPADDPGAYLAAAIMAHAEAITKLAEAIELNASAGKEAVIKVKVDGGELTIPQDASLIVTKVERARTDW